MKCLSNYDTLQHVTESSERFIFITDVCGICKGFFRGKTEHYFPNEIHSMVIYEAHLSLCKLWPLSEAAYPRAETGVSGGNELHSILQPKIYMFKPKLGKESAKLKTASSKTARSCLTTSWCCPSLVSGHLLCKLEK
ncbi:unnamed protein product [Eretmochelys imbricata]